MCVAGLAFDARVPPGWKRNPVQFDSVLNRASYSWSFGSPDIVPMFVDTVPHAEGFTYDSSLEDFGSQGATPMHRRIYCSHLCLDTSELDSWVFREVRGMFADVSKNKTRARLFEQRGNIFFLHLLGLDTAGHADTPNSKECVLLSKRRT